MELNLILYGIYMVMLFVCVVVGVMIWYRMKGAIKIFFMLIMVVACSEAIALLAELLTGRNDQIYNTTDILQAILLFCYFATATKKYLLGTGLCIVTLCFGIYNYYWVQYDEVVNNYFLLWNGVVAISFSLYLIVELYQKDGVVELSRFASFWIANVVLFYWITNLMNLQIFNTLIAVEVSYAVMLNAAHLASNIICYAAIAIIFYRTPLLIQ